MKQNQIKTGVHGKDKLTLDKLRNFKEIQEKMKEPLDNEFFAKDSFRSYIEEDLFEYQSKLAYF